MRRVFSIPKRSLVRVSPAPWISSTLPCFALAAGDRGAEPRQPGPGGLLLSELPVRFFELAAQTVEDPPTFLGAGGSVGSVACISAAAAPFRPRPVSLRPGRGQAGWGVRPGCLGGPRTPFLSVSRPPLLRFARRRSRCDRAGGRQAGHWGGASSPLLVRREIATAGNHI